jgi:hypothetical protein
LLPFQKEYDHHLTPELMAIYTAAQEMKKNCCPPFFGGGIYIGEEILKYGHMREKNLGF